MSSSYLRYLEVLTRPVRTLGAFAIPALSLAAMAVPTSAFAAEPEGTPISPVEQPAPGGPRTDPPGPKTDAQQADKQAEQTKAADQIQAGDGSKAAESAKSSWFSTSGEARVGATIPPDFVVDAEGNKVGQDLVLDTRLRVGLGATTHGVSLRTEWDLLDNQLFGDPWDIRGTEDARHRESVGVTGNSFAARRLALDGRVGPLAMEGGIVTSHWGLGMLANDGAHDPEFGQTEFGDRVLRLRLATRPIENVPLTFGIAGDRVLEDETADWNIFEDGGEAAYQALASVMYGTPEKGRVGIYGVYRDQVESDLIRQTQVGVIDVYADFPVKLASVDLRFAAESAGIFGTTNRGASYNSRDGLAVSSGGFTALAEAKVKPIDLRGVLRFGLASGDENPDDGSSGAFSFDRDFDVGMVMFEQVQGAVDAAAYAQLTDPEHSGGAPDGAESIVGEGAFRQAMFVQPIASVAPIKNVEVKVGVLLAWATTPISQPYATYRNGGVPANFLGETTEGYDLGSEIDWSLKLGDREVKVLRAKVTPAILIQGGHYFASADMGGGVHHLATGSVRLRW